MKVKTNVTKYGLGLGYLLLQLYIDVALSSKTFPSNDYRPTILKTQGFSIDRFAKHLEKRLLRTSNETKVFVKTKIKLSKEIRKKKASNENWHVQP